MKVTFNQEKEWAELPDEVKQPYWDLVCELLGDAMHCQRDWSAWGWNTMQSNDFSPAYEDDDYVNNLAMNMYYARKNSEEKLSDEESHF